MLTNRWQKQLTSHGFWTVISILICLSKQDNKYMSNGNGNIASLNLLLKPKSNTQFRVEYVFLCYLWTETEVDTEICINQSKTSRIWFSAIPDHCT